MRKLSFALAMVVLPVCLLAQDAPKAEVFGGYSHLHTSGQGFNGFDAQFTYNQTEGLSVTGDVSGAYAGQSVNVSGVGGASAHAHSYTFLVGPSYAYRKLDKFVPFAHVLVGIAHGSSSAQTNILGGQSINVSTSDTGFGLALGGGVDYTLNDSWALRPVQIDYVSVNVGGGHANAFRYAAGIVYRISR
ncbi:MAG TPA: outer membrane beta-barrel protein [Terriglobales bacterium]|nr:outer membrane beta-barrel protein [Terriglobales bacterium]